MSQTGQGRSCVFWPHLPALSPDLPARTVPLPLATRGCEHAKVARPTGELISLFQELNFQFYVIVSDLNVNSQWTVPPWMPELPCGTGQGAGPWCAPRGTQHTARSELGVSQDPCPVALGWKPPLPDGAGSLQRCRKLGPLSVSQAEAAVDPAPGSPLLWAGIFSVQYRNVGYSTLSRNST